MHTTIINSTTSVTGATITKTKVIKVKLSGVLRVMLNYIKTYYMLPGCQKSLSAISQEWLRGFSWTFQDI